jgi:hypothetical protein
MRKLLAGAVAGCLVAAAPAAATAADRYGLTSSDRLIRFSESSPSTLKVDVPISGAGADVDGIASSAGRLLARSTDGRYFQLRQTDGTAEFPVSGSDTLIEEDGSGTTSVAELFSSPEPTSDPATTDTAPVQPPVLVYGAGRMLGAPGMGSLREGDASPEGHYLTRLGDPLVAYAPTGVYYAPGWGVGVEATPGADYDAEPFTIRFAPRQLVRPLANPLVDDDVPDEGESLCLSFATERGCNVAFGTWDNGDAQFTVGTVAATEEEGGATLEVRRVVDPLRPSTASVDVVPRAGTAAAGSDFAAAPIRVDFAAGESLRRVRVPLVDDTAAEPEESLTALLQQAGGGRLLAGADKTVTVTVRDADPAPPTAPRTAADRTAPTARLSLARSLRLTRRLRVPFTCSEACIALVELRLDARSARRAHLRARLARGTAKGKAGRRAAVSLRLSRTTLARLRRARVTRASVVLTVRDAAGNRRVVRKAIRLRR